MLDKFIPLFNGSVDQLALGDLVQVHPFQKTHELIIIQLLLQFFKVYLVDDFLLHGLCVLPDILGIVQEIVNLPVEISVLAARGTGSAFYIDERYPTPPDVLSFLFLQFVLLFLSLVHDLGISFDFLALLRVRFVNSWGSMQTGRRSWRSAVGAAVVAVGFLEVKYLLQLLHALLSFLLNDLFVLLVVVLFSVIVVVLLVFIRHVTDFFAVHDVVLLLALNFRVFFEVDDGLAPRFEVLAYILLHISFDFLLELDNTHIIPALIPRCFLISRVHIRTYSTLPLCRGPVVRRVDLVLYFGRHVKMQIELLDQPIDLALYLLLW